jgi:hypothetical protein
MATFKELYNQVGEKYLKLRIDKILIDYKILCYILVFVEQLNSDDIRDELEDVIVDIKAKLENTEIEEVRADV